MLTPSKIENIISFLNFKILLGLKALKTQTNSINAR
jgi:hypothetical protein